MGRSYIVKQRSHSYENLYSEILLINYFANMTIAFPKKLPDMPKGNWKA